MSYTTLLICSNPWGRVSMLVRKESGEDEAFRRNAQRPSHTYNATVSPVEYAT